MRFFFDYTTKDRSLYDFKGDEFHSPQGAIEFAEAIAEDLNCSLSNDWLGWWIEVRNAEGTRFFALPVDTAGAFAG